MKTKGLFSSTGKFIVTHLSQHGGLQWWACKLASLLLHYAHRHIIQRLLTLSLNSWILLVRDACNSHCGTTEDRPCQMYVPWHCAILFWPENFTHMHVRKKHTFTQLFDAAAVCFIKDVGIISYASNYNSCGKLFSLI